jgi:hypothetical protein
VFDGIGAGFVRVGHGGRIVTGEARDWQWERAAKSRRRAGVPAPHDPRIVVVGCRDG